VSPRAPLLIDDRLLISCLLSTTDPLQSERIATTSLWYYRTCRAAVVGAGGELSGPFQRLGYAHQRAATRHLLELDDSIELADPRKIVPMMAEIAERHPKLNLLNLEAVAAARVLQATVALSPKAALGVLPQVLDTESVEYRKVKPW